MQHRFAGRHRLVVLAVLSLICAPSISAKAEPKHDAQQNLLANHKKRKAKHAKAEARKKKKTKLEEQIENACSVFSGIVEEVLKGPFGEYETIILKNYEVIKSSFFHKFKSPESLEISGFGGDTEDLPKKDDNLAVFVCPNKEEDSWRTIGKFDNWHKRFWSLNNYADRPGFMWIDKDDKNLDRIRKIAWDRLHGKWYGNVNFECKQDITADK